MSNILVHGYLDVDNDIIWNALFELEDFHHFAATIERLLDSGD